MNNQAMLSTPLIPEGLNPRLDEAHERLTEGVFIANGWIVEGRLNAEAAAELSEGLQELDRLIGPIARTYQELAQLTGVRNAFRLLLLQKQDLELANAMFSQAIEERAEDAILAPLRERVVLRVQAYTESKMSLGEAEGRLNKAVMARHARAVEQLADAMAALASRLKAATRKPAPVLVPM